MRIINLTESKSMIYSSNAYLILGDWNALDDANTLVDVGNDPTAIEKIRQIATGVGKKAIEQVIITHGHFDHTGILPQMRQAFAPLVYAQSTFVGPDIVMEDGARIKCGDRTFEVIYTPGHSDDSICLYCQTDGALFVGDTPVVIRSNQQTYDARFVNALEQLCHKDVHAIYFGHGDPILQNAQQVLTESLKNVMDANRTREVINL